MGKCNSCRRRHGASAMAEFRDALFKSITKLREDREEKNNEIRDAESKKVEIESLLPKLSMDLARQNDSIDRLKKLEEQVNTALDKVKASKDEVAKSTRNYEKVQKDYNDYKVALG